MNLDFSASVDGARLRVRSVRQRFLPNETVSDRPHKHYSMEFHCVFGGKEIIDFPKIGSKITLQAGQILLIPQDYYHAVTTENGTVERICFHFSAEEGEARKSGVSPLPRPVKKPLLFEDDYAQALMELCHREQLLPESPRGGARQGLLMISAALRLLSVSFEPPKEKASAVSDRRWIILDYMERHFTDPQGLEGLAKALFLSRRQTSSLVKKYLGMDFKTAVRTRRMELADIYLQKGNLSLEEIAWQVGYRSYSGFQLSFKEHFGITPSARQRELKSQKE